MTGQTPVVVLSDRRTIVQELLQKMDGPIRVLPLGHSREICAIRRDCRNATRVVELSRREVARNHEADFRTAYVELLGRFNAKNRGMPWTVMPFTSKNPLSTDLCENAFQMIMIARLVAADPSTPLLVLTSNVDLASQVRSWGADSGVAVTSSVRGAAVARRFLMNYSPAAIVVAFIRAMVMLMLLRRLRPPRSAVGCIAIVSTLPQSRVEDGHYREAYFSPLVEHLSGSGQSALIFLLITTRLLETAWLLRKASSSLPVVPAEACLTLPDLIGCGLQGISNWRLRPDFEGCSRLSDVDIRPLMQMAIKECRRSSSLFRHLLVHRAALRLAQRVQLSGCLYPFENRANERALLLGFRGVGSPPVMVGCQNAALTPSHLNFVLTEEEVGALPLPDYLFTTGPYVRDRLIGEGHLPQERVRVGCALRQRGKPIRPISARPAHVRRVLVVLASGPTEYFEMLTFVAEAFNPHEGESVRFRPHPEFPFPSQKSLPPPVQDLDFEISPGSLAEDLGWADVVLYASSTVSMEAVARGLPVVYADVGHLLSADPLSDRTNGLRWTAEKPGSVRDCFRAIEEMTDDEFVRRRETDQRFIDAYLQPADEEKLQTLVEAAGCGKLFQ